MKRTFEIGETVYFHGGDASEDDRGIVRSYKPGYLVVRWHVAGETYVEDPDDEQIQRTARVRGAQ